MSKVFLGDVAKERKETCKGSKTGYPIVGLEHLTPEEITLSAWEENKENSFTKLFRKGDVLFGRRRAYLKKAVVAPFDGICSGDITVIEAIQDKILPELLPFVIQNDALFDFAVGKSAGSLSPRVKWEHLKNYEFELPDLEKQRELAKVLWAMDATKKSYQKLLQKTDELVKSQFIEMMRCATTQKKLTECADVLYGFPFNSKKFNSDGIGVPLIRIRDINTGFSNTYTTEEADPKYLIKRGDCIVGMDGTFEIVKWAHEDAFLNQRVCKITPNAVKKEYLIYYLRIKLKELEENAQSTTVKHLSAKDINLMIIPLADELSQNAFEALSLQSSKSKFELEQALVELTATYKKVISENLG
jgi:type I restriction enzyme, S subunit